MAFALVNGSKKGISAHQLHRSLGITYKSAWFMHHRIREAMSMDAPDGWPRPHVEADETYIGRDKTKAKSRTAIRHMNKVVSLVDRNDRHGAQLPRHRHAEHGHDQRILFTNVRRDSRLLTDEAHFYRRPGLGFCSSRSRQSRSQRRIRFRAAIAPFTRTRLKAFSIFKRGMKGIYQHCSSEAPTALSVRV
jgi:hypothetical protein